MHMYTFWFLLWQNASGPSSSSTSGNSSKDETVNGELPVNRYEVSVCVEESCKVTY